MGHKKRQSDWMYKETRGETADTEEWYIMEVSLYNADIYESSDESSADS